MTCATIQGHNEIRPWFLVRVHIWVPDSITVRVYVDVYCSYCCWQPCDYLGFRLASEAMFVSEDHVSSGTIQIWVSSFTAWAIMTLGPHCAATGVCVDVFCPCYHGDSFEPYVEPCFEVWGPCWVGHVLLTWEEPTPTITAPAPHWPWGSGPPRILAWESLVYFA